MFPTTIVNYHFNVIGNLNILIDLVENTMITFPILTFPNNKGKVKFDFTQIKLRFKS